MSQLPRKCGVLNISQPYRSPRHVTGIALLFVSYYWYRLQIKKKLSCVYLFTNKRVIQRPIYINGTQIPYANTSNYLGMTIDTKLRWKEHIKMKRDELNIKFRKMYWLLGRNSELSIYIKLILYKQVLRPVWGYGIQLWGCASDSNIQVIQRFQNKKQRRLDNTAQAPWYIRYSDFNRDLGIETVTHIITRLASSHKRRLRNHINSEVSRLLNVQNIPRRLKRKKPFELVKQLTTKWFGGSDLVIKYLK
jgi:hypothetical protein